MHTLPENWVVFRLSALGDVLLTTGVLRYLQERHGWRFHVLTKEPFAPVFTGNPRVEKVLAASPADLASPRMRAWFSELAARYEGWGLLDLHGTMRSALLASRWKGPVKRYAKYAFARRLFLYSGGRMCGKILRLANVPQRYALAVEKTPPEASSLVPEMYLTDTERGWGKSFLANLFGDDVLKNASSRFREGRGPYVALHPYASHPHKAWPGERYALLVSRLEEKRLPWFVLGRGEPVFPGEPRDLTGKTTLRESAALLAASAVLVSGDSGPMHLATAVGTPVIGLFGPTTREWGFFPSGPEDRVVELDHPCRPCSLHGQKGCPRHGECLALIEPETVMSVLGDILDRNGETMNASDAGIRK